MRFFKTQNINEIFCEPKLNASWNIKYDSHSESSYKIHLWLKKSTNHVTELIFIFVSFRLILVWIWSYKAIMSILKHSFSQILAEFSSAIQLFVGEKKKGYNKAGNKSDLNIKWKFKLNILINTLLSVEIMIAVIPYPINIPRGTQICNRVNHIVFLFPPCLSIQMG